MEVPMDLPSAYNKTLSNVWVWRERRWVGEKPWLCHLLSCVALGRLLRLSESWFPVSKMGFIIAGSWDCSGWNEIRE